MGFKRFASFQVLSAVLAPADASHAQLRTIAHRHHFDYQPRPGYLYVRSRAISSRCNDNFDEFPAEEIKKSFATFIGKPTFVNHNNDDHRRARGVILDAALHEDRNADGSPDTWCEVLMEIDAIRFPKLAEAILKGHIDRTSMGCDVAFSVCSACGNRATSPAEYCSHIPNLKGKMLYRTTASGVKQGEVIRELCYGLGFFENSLLVEEPADPTAVVVSVVSGDTGVEAAHRTASTHALPSPAVPYRAKPSPAKPSLALKTDPTKGSARASALAQVARKSVSTPVPRVPLVPAQRPRTPHTAVTQQPHHGQDLVGWFASALRPDPAAFFDEAAKASSSHGSPIYLADIDVLGATKKPVAEMSEAEYAAHVANAALGKKWNRDHPSHPDNIIDHWNAATNQERHEGMHWYADAHDLTKHILDDANHKNGTTHGMDVAAGVMSTYSPKKFWATNMMHASMALMGQKGIGGPGSGVYASNSQRRAADRIMGTAGKIKEHYEKVLGGPKTKAFAHLIEHGTNKDPKKLHVVIDRHALSVASGAKASENSYEQSSLGGKNPKRYRDISNDYHQAAKYISKHLGIQVDAHQVQAATWLARQRLNGDEYPGISGRSRGEYLKWDGYSEENHPGIVGKAPGTGYANKPPPPADAPEDVHHDYEMDQQTADDPLHKPVPVTNPRRKTRLAGFIRPKTDQADKTSIRQNYIGSRQVTAFGETMAPADVDTLRDEECPVCGSSDTYDGSTCEICGYDAPPKMFQDPNLDLAQQLDLRQNQGQDAGLLPGQDGLNPQQDANGGMPPQIPGDPGDPGDPDAPLDPSQVAPDGSLDPAPIDPAQIIEEQVEQLQSGVPLTPDQLGPDGQVLPPQTDPNGAPVDPNVDPNADPQVMDEADSDQMIDPSDPGATEQVEPGGPLDPSQLDANGNPIDGQQLAVPPANPEPGTPEDGVPDLICPVCGYEADARQPQSVDMDAQATPDAGMDDGTMAGDICPNCGQGQMISVGDMEQMAQEQPPQVT